MILTQKLKFGALAAQFAKIQFKVSGVGFQAKTRHLKLNL